MDPEASTSATGGRKRKKSNRLENCSVQSSSSMSDCHSNPTARKKTRKSPFTRVSSSEVVYRYRPAWELKNIPKPPPTKRYLHNSFVQLERLPDDIKEASKVVIKTYNAAIPTKRFYKIECTPPGRKFIIGVLGCGGLGTIVAKLLLPNYVVNVYNRTRKKCVPLAELSAHVCFTASELAKKSDVIFCCLKNKVVTKKVITGQVNPYLGRGKIVVVLNTLDYQSSRFLSRLVNNHNGYYVEAPVLRKRVDKPVECASDLFMLACGDKFEDIEHILNSIAKEVLRFDSVGEATKTCLIVNTFLGSLLASFSEAEALAKSLGYYWEDVIGQILLVRGLFPSLFQSEDSNLVSKEVSEHLKLEDLEESMLDCINLASTSGVSIPVGSAAHQVLVERRCHGESDRFTKELPYMGGY